MVGRRPYRGTWVAAARKQTMAQCWLCECLFYMFAICIIKKCHTDHTLLKHLQVLIPCNLGRTHWAMASIDLTSGHIYLMDPFRRDVPFRHRKMQLTCLRYFLPSMLLVVDFHDHRRRGDMMYPLTTRTFTFYYMSADHVPQQEIGYDCFKIWFYPNSFS